jgi:hypothetical protein
MQVSDALEDPAAKLKADEAAEALLAELEAEDEAQKTRKRRRRKETRTRTRLLGMLR